MPRSRVFILYSHGLFARGVQSLLTREEGVDVVGMERSDHPAMDRIRVLHPDVILVDSAGQGEEARLALSEIFQELPGARVISLNLQGNGIDIYDTQRIIASGPEDLVRAIRRGDQDSRLKGKESGGAEDAETWGRGDAKNDDCSKRGPVSALSSRDSEL